MVKNELINFRIKLMKRELFALHEKIIRDTLDKMTHVYSYILYNHNDSYDLDVLYSKTKVLNTIPLDDMITDVIKSETTPRATLQLTGNAMTFAQPPVDILLVTYKPLIYHLAVQQHNHWPQIELEDLIQMCNLRICVLYQQGYYIHKNLLTRSFMNDVLMFLRPEKHKPIVESLDTIVSVKDDELSVSRVEMIEDERVADELISVIDKLDGSTLQDEIEMKMLEIVKEFVTPRMYDQLLREYGNKTTTNKTRVMVNRLKSQIKDLGITLESITDQILRRN